MAEFKQSTCHPLLSTLSTLSTRASDTCLLYITCKKTDGTASCLHLYLSTRTSLHLLEVEETELAFAHSSSHIRTRNKDNKILRSIKNPLTLPARGP